MSLAMTCGARQRGQQVHHGTCYDAYMPRTTLVLDSDATIKAKAYARRHGITLGEAVSDLVKRGAERPLVIEDRNGFPVVCLPADSPTVAAAAVKRALEDFP